MDIDKVKKQAEAEINDEDFKEAVEDCKVKLRTKTSFLDTVWPWKISITKK